MAIVTAAIALLKPHVPVLSLGVLYVFAVLPIAVVWGIALALPVSVASMLAFEWFYLPPIHRFSLANSENWFALAATSRRRSSSASWRHARAGEPRPPSSASASRRCSRGSRPTCSGARPRRGAAGDRRTRRRGARCRSCRDRARRRRAPGQRRLAVPPRGRGRLVGTIYTPVGRPNPPPSAASCRRSLRCLPSRSTGAGSSGTRSRPRRCAAATSSRLRSCARSPTTCARR